jgi:hypothetical protein
MVRMIVTQPVVTPVHSREDSAAEESHECLRKLQEGSDLSASDWEEIGREKNQIPVYSKYLPSQIKGGSLVRVRGMVQDMFEAEYFSTSLIPSHSLNGNSLAERTPLFLSPVPFTTPWYQEELNDGASSEENQDMHRSKRLRLEETGEEDQSSECNNQNRWWCSEYMKSDPHQTPVLAKFYYDQYGAQSPKILLNELVEAVGILEWEEDVTSSSGTNNTTPVTLDDTMGPGAHTLWADEGIDTVIATTIPTDIPRLHVLWYQTFTLDQSLYESGHEDFTKDSFGGEDCHQAPNLLSQALSVSELSANLLWMTLLSQAERHVVSEESSDPHWTPVSTPDNTTLGCLSTQFVLPDTSDCRQLAQVMEHVLSQVLPAVYVVTITQEALTLLRPPTKRNGRIEPTPMQLPRGATLVLNASELEEGHLLASQIETLQSFQSIALNHSVPYEFDGGVHIAFEADVRVLVLCTAKTAKIVPCHEQVKCDFNAHRYHPGTILQTAHKLRQVLASTRKLGISHRCNPNNIALSNSLLDRAQKDFIQRRLECRQQKRSELYTEQDFHRWLTLTRLQARSRKSATANISDWERALALDDARNDEIQLFQ